MSRKPIKILIGHVNLTPENVLACFVISNQNMALDYTINQRPKAKVLDIKNKN